MPVNSSFCFLVDWVIGYLGVCESECLSLWVVDDFTRWQLVEYINAREERPVAASISANKTPRYLKQNGNRLVRLMHCC